jgi:HTH-type transcriptional regulator/antitoxin HipB
MQQLALRRTGGRRSARPRIELVSAKAIFDIYRFNRYISCIVNTDKCADMKQILTHSAQLGQILVTRRRASKLSQRALAAKLAISQNRLSEIETDPGTLTVERLLELANLLGLELVIHDRPSPQGSSKTEW